jgi:Base plate wedge protein 53
MSANYSNTSPWYNTTVTNNYLDILTIRPVSAEVDDILYTIDSKFAYRPDLLAYALYGTTRLWWVFMQRNLDVIQDPILDFVPGKQIYLCKNSSLTTALGL